MGSLGNRHGKSLAGSHPQRRSSRRRGDHFQDGRREIWRPDRLADVVVHAGRQAFLLVAFHGMGGHGDDRDVASRHLLALANGRARLQSVHVRHFDIHQHEVEDGLLQKGQGLPAVGGAGHLVTLFLEKPHSHLPVYRVVLSQQDR